MTEDDKNNLVILDKMFEKNFDLDPKSIEFAKNWLREPKLDPKFAAIVGDDFRARWDIPVSDFGENKDKAWALFQMYFGSGTCSSLGITYDAFLSNTCKVGKDNVKISKVLNKCFASNPGIFKSLISNQGRQVFADLKVPVDIGAMISESNEEKIKGNIEIYITRANEKIGQIKLPKEQAGYQIVLSFNFVDWLLASTGDSFTSCIGLESSHGYWFGLPFMLDDRSRGFLYITKKVAEKKEYLGLKADHLSNREWVFLANDDTLHGFRWYPKDTPVEITFPMLSKLTGLSISSEGFTKSKYPIGENIHVKNTNVFCTPYLDNVGIQKYSEDGKYYYSTRNGSSGANICGDRHNGSNIYNGSILLKTLYKTGLGNIEARDYSVCSQCMVKYKRTEIRFFDVVSEDGVSESVCPTCYEKKYTKCEECGRTHIKEELKKTKDYKKGICKSCFSSLYIKCESCGEISLARSLKNGICEKCVTDTTKIVICEYSKELLVKKKAFPVYNKDTIWYFKDADAYSLFAEDEGLNKKNFKGCDTCGEVSHNSVLIQSYTGEVICRKCADKAALKKQLWFDFSVPKKKKEKAVKAG